MQSVHITTDVVISNLDQGEVHLCDKVCQWLMAGQWFSQGTPVSCINKTDHHDITEILLKKVLNTITLVPPPSANSGYRKLAFLLTDGTKS